MQHKPTNESLDGNETEFRLLQPIWDLRLGHEHIIANPIFPVVMSVTCYFTVCSLYCALDMFLTRYVKRFKIQDDKVVTWPQIFKAVRHTVINNFILILPTAVAQFIWVPDSPLPSKAPTVFEFVFQIAAILVIFDFQYFVWHMLHHKSRWLYRTFHAIHHQYHSVFSWTTQYLHPWELLTVGFYATVDPWFFNCHPMTCWGFMIANILISIEAHSGFDFPFFLHNIIPFGIYGGGPKHDMHHLKPLTNFQPFFTTFDVLAGSACPGLGAQRYKSPRLLAWEARNKGQRRNKAATELMGGTENGWLSPDKGVKAAHSRLNGHTSNGHTKSE